MNAKTDIVLLLTEKKMFFVAAFIKSLPVFAFTLGEFYILWSWDGSFNTFRMLVAMCFTLTLYWIVSVLHDWRGYRLMSRIN